jgi:hypothetical protein
MGTRVTNEIVHEKNRALQYLVICVIAGFATNCFPYSGSVHRYLSHMSTYRELHLGMSRSDAIKILWASNLDCGSSYPSGSPPRSCKFWDFWRVYSVNFGPGSEGPLELKYYGYRRRRSSLSRVATWIRRRVL